MAPKNFTMRVGGEVNMEQLETSSIPLEGFAYIPVTSGMHFITDDRNVYNVVYDADRQLTEVGRKLYLTGVAAGIAAFLHMNRTIVTPEQLWQQLKEWVELFDKIRLGDPIVVEEVVPKDPYKTQSDN